MTELYFTALFRVGWWHQAQIELDPQCRLVARQKALKRVIQSWFGTLEVSQSTGRGFHITKHKGWSHTRLTENTRKLLERSHRRKADLATWGGEGRCFKYTRKEGTTRHRCNTLRRGWVITQVGHLTGRGETTQNPNKIKHKHYIQNNWQHSLFQMKSFNLTDHIFKIATSHFWQPPLGRFSLAPGGSGGEGWVGCCFPTNIHDSIPSWSLNPWASVTLRRCKNSKNSISITTQNLGLSLWIVKCYKIGSRIYSDKWSTAKKTHPWCNQATANSLLPWSLFCPSCRAWINIVGHLHDGHQYIGWKH